MPDEWRPDPLWLPLDDILDNQIGFIVDDRDMTSAASRVAFTVTTASGNYTVDWGDGTTDTLASGAVADHKYAIGGGKLSSDGHTTYKMRISSGSAIIRFWITPVKNNVNIANSLLMAVFNTVGLTSLSSAFQFCTSLQSVTFTSLPVCTSLSNAFQFCISLQAITLPADLGQSAVSVDMTSAFQRVPSVWVVYLPYAKLTKLSIMSDDSSRPCGLIALTFSAQSTFSGTAPQIDIQRSNMSRAALVDVFNQLPALTGKQINITGCTGAKDLTAAERQIATGKGWTIVG